MLLPRFPGLRAQTQEGSACLFDRVTTVWLCRLARVVAVVALFAGVASAQESGDQDQLDFQGRGSVVVGSGARAFGMGGAFLARADDATAASWNPAGLSYLRLPELSLVGVRDIIDVEGRDAAGALGLQDRRTGDVPDFAALAYPVSLGSVSGAVQLSFQRVLSVDGERDITKTDTQQRITGSGGFDVLALGTGLQVSHRLRLGATFNYWFSGYHQTRERLLHRRSRQETEFDISGFNLNLGLIWSPFENFNVGAVAKTPFTADVTLTRSRTDYVKDDSDLPADITTNAYQADDVRLDFPGAVGFGASWRPLSPLTLSADYTRTFWSDAHIHNFFVLPSTPAGTRANPTPEKPKPTAPGSLFASLSYPTLKTDPQEDTEQIRAGVEYVLIFDRLKIPLRAGYFNDRQYQRAADGSAPRYNGFTLGTGLLAGPVLLDLAYVYESGEVTDPSEARTSVVLQRFIVSLIYRHGSQ